VRDAEFTDHSVRSETLTILSVYHIRPALSLPSISD